MILDRVIGTTFKNLSYISPFISLTLVRDEKNQLFFKAPGILLYLWVEMIVPSLSALLTNSTWKMLCYIGPLLWSLFLDKPQYKSIFFNTPRPFHKLWIEDFLPSMKTLHICPSLKTLSDLLPVSAPVLLYSDGKLLVFLSRPVSFIGSILILGGASLIQIWIFPLSSNNLLLLRHCKVITIAWGCLV